MRLEIVIGFRWWCSCGWHSPHGKQGAGVLMREHKTGCSFSNRPGRRAISDDRWMTLMQISDLSTRRFWRAPMPPPENLP